MNLQLVYLCMFSLSKNENMFYEKKKKQKQKQKDHKKEKSFCWRESDPRLPTGMVNALSVAPPEQKFEDRCWINHF